MREISLLSVVIPCHNEEEVLSLTHQRLTRVLRDLSAVKKGLRYEILYVDNGSTDKTPGVLKDIFDSDTQVRIIVLADNAGYQGAFCAGLAFAEGDAVITMDADLQDPPEKIREMVGCFEEGYDLVLGVRGDRSADGFLKRISSENFYRFIRFMGGRIVFNHGDFRLMSKSLVRDFNNSAAKRFIRSEVLRLEKKYAVVYYKREPRIYGTSKFNMRASLMLALDGLAASICIPFGFCTYNRKSAAREKPLFRVRQEYRHTV